HLQRIGSGIRTGNESQARHGRLAVVDVSPSLDGHVHHRQWTRLALLHRALLPARLRELYAWQRYPADVARNLERRGLSQFPRRSDVRQTADRMPELRFALEPVI